MQVRAFIYTPTYMKVVFDDITVEADSTEETWDLLVALARDHDWETFRDVVDSVREEAAAEEEWIFANAWPSEGWEPTGVPAIDWPVPSFTDEHAGELTDPAFGVNLNVNLNNPYKVEMFQLDTGALIGTYDTVKQAYQRTAINSSNIRKVLRGERQSAGGYGWRFAGSNIIFEDGDPTPIDLDDASREISEDANDADFEDWAFKHATWDRIV